jgi:hypothetical protein
LWARETYKVCEELGIHNTAPAQKGLENVGEETEMSLSCPKDNKEMRTGLVGRSNKGARRRRVKDDIFLCLPTER